MQYQDLPSNNFRERLKKARLLKGFNKQDIFNLTGVSRLTITEIENGHRNTIQKDTLVKLLTILDKNILCDDYCYYILNQKDNIIKLLSKYEITELSKLLKTRIFVIEHWINEDYQISRWQYELISKLN